MAMMTLPTSSRDKGAAVADSARQRDEGRAARFKLWVDGVGGYLVCLGATVTFGGPGGSADVSLMAGLPRKQATFVRSGESYLLDAHGPTRVSGRSVEGLTHLANNYSVEFGDQLTLRFRQPTVVSATAVLEPTDGAFLLAPESGRMTTQSLDGVVLMDGALLLGPGWDKHIVCDDWEETLLLFRRGGELLCKSPAPLHVDGRPIRADEPIPVGAVVTGSDARFRWEACG